MVELKQFNPPRGNAVLVGSILAAFGASICCVGPLVLLALGISGAWISSLTALEPYRPIFMGLTLLFLGFAFYRLYLAASLSARRWPTAACQFFYECVNCKTLLRPKSGDCCVFCSYGSVKCPPM
jgi:hypothetical protein